MSADAENLERDRLEFEREKWRAEIELRQRDQRNQDIEIELKRADQLRSRWTNPLVVAILAAGLAGASNALVAAVNSYFQRRLEDSKANAQLLLEEGKAKAQIVLENSKAESNRILEMIKTGDPKAAENNLRFLIESGLIADVQLTTKINQFLAKGTPPSLPASSTRFEMDPSSDLSPSAQNELQKTLTEYANHLDNLGMTTNKDRIRIVSRATGDVNTYFLPSERVISIHSRLAMDRHVVLREYTHHSLLSATAHFNDEEILIIESALADYLPCSFLNDPRVGHLAAATLKLNRPYIRNLENQRDFHEIEKLERAKNLYDGAEIWGGALWAIRVGLDGSVLDPLVARAWAALLKSNQKVQPELFIQVLLSEAAKLDTAKARMMEDVFLARGFPVRK